MLRNGRIHYDETKNLHTPYTFFLHLRATRRSSISSLNRRREDGRPTGDRRRRSSGQRGLGVGQVRNARNLREEEERLGVRE